MNCNEEAIIGCVFEFWTSYLEAERDMLYRRTCLLMEYENANRHLDRAARTQKKDLAEQSKLDAERAFEDCCDAASSEIKRFHRERSQIFGSALEKYGEAQLLVARDTFSVLEKHLKALKDFQL